LKVVTGFKEFITRGNVVELAVAVVIGAAFGALIQSLVADLLTPIIAAIVGEPDFSDLAFTINGSRFTYGNFINALIAFISIAAAVYFFVVVPMNHFKHEEEESTRECPECLTEIPREARRCSACTSVVDPV
jgi:large conductance mechanosensitive channel